MPDRIVLGFAFGWAAVLAGCAAQTLPLAPVAPPRVVAPPRAVAAGSARVALTGDGTHAEDDAERLVSRLRAGGTEARVEEAAGGRIVLALSHAASAEAAIQRALAGHTLTLQLVAVDQSDLEAPAAGPDPLGLNVREVTVPAGMSPNGASVSQTYRMYTGDSPAELRAVLARAPSRPDRVARVECSRAHDEEPYCWAWALETPAPFDEADVAHAEVSIRIDTGEPYLAIELAAASATRFERFTRDNVQRRIAIVVDDEILSMPVINEAISTGRVSLTMGAGAGTDRDRLRATDRIARAMTHGGLADHWSVESIVAR